MKIIYNNIIPFPGFGAINLFGIIFARRSVKQWEGSRWFNEMLNHESIHTQQQLELGFIFFYIFYLIEWLIKVFIAIFTAGKVRAYKSISYEQEAYNNQSNLDYLKTRKRYNWIKYIFKVVK